MQMNSGAWFLREPQRSFTQNPSDENSGNQVNFRADKVNAVYGLFNADMGKFHAKECDSGTWMADVLFLEKAIP